LTTFSIVALFRILALVKSLAGINCPDTNTGPDILEVTTTNNNPVTIATASAPYNKTNLLFTLSLSPIVRDYFNLIDTPVCALICIRLLGISGIRIIISTGPTTLLI